MNHQCAWIGRGEGCQEVSVVGRSYCAAHMARVYTKVARSKRPRKATIDAAQLQDLFVEALAELEVEGYDLASPVH